MKKWFVGMIFFVSILLTSCGVERSTERERNEPWKVTSIEPESVADGETLKESKPEKDLLQCMMQVQTDTRLGSGILWEKREEEWIVVTAAHVVEGLQEAEVYLVQEDKFLSAKVMEVNGLDLAFLTVQTSFLEAALEEEYQSVISMKGSVEEKAEVLAVGYNAQGELCEFPGTVIDDWIYVEDFDNYMLLCDCQAKPGMSGGVVVTADGKLAGLICGENEKGMLAVLPIGVIKSEYELFQEN